MAIYIYSFIFTFPRRCRQWPGSPLAEKESWSPTTVDKEGETQVLLLFVKFYEEKRQCDMWMLNTFNQLFNILQLALALPCVAILMWFFNNENVFANVLRSFLFISRFAYWTIATFCGQQGNCFEPAMLNVLNKLWFHNFK